MDKILLTYTCLSAGFFAGNAATMFLTHWLRAVMAAFGRGPVSAPHRIDALAVLMMTLLHPVPWMLVIGGWLGIHRVIFGPTTGRGVYGANQHARAAFIRATLMSIPNGSRWICAVRIVRWRMWNFRSAGRSSECRVLPLTRNRFCVL